MSAYVPSPEAVEAAIVETGEWSQVVEAILTVAVPIELARVLEPVVADALTNHLPGPLEGLEYVLLSDLRAILEALPTEGEKT